SESCFKIAGFGERAAVEVALRVKAALSAHDKKESLKSPWKKIKYDRQIVAIARCENCSIIYSADRDIHDHAKLWGMKVLNISDLPVPAKQGVLALDIEKIEKQKTQDKGGNP